MIKQIDMNDGDVVIGVFKDGEFYAKKASLNTDFVQSFYQLCGGLIRTLKQKNIMNLDYKFDVTSWDNDSKKCGFRIVE